MIKDLELKGVWKTYTHLPRFPTLQLPVFHIENGGEPKKIAWWSRPRGPQEPHKEPQRIRGALWTVWASAWEVDSSTLTKGLDIVFRECRNEFRKKQTGKGDVERYLASTPRGDRRKDVRLCDDKSASNTCGSFRKTDIRVYRGMNTSEPTGESVGEWKSRWGCLQRWTCWTERLVASF